jgi:hypothetical protein
MEDEENVIEELNLEEIAEEILEDEQANDPDADTLGTDGVEGTNE